jgi:CBS domain containing-hemolysin-like protein
MACMRDATWRPHMNTPDGLLLHSDTLTIDRWAQDTSITMHKTKQSPHQVQPADPRRRRAQLKYLGLIGMVAALHATSAHASMFKGEALDKAADVITWVVLILAPIIAIAVFWLVHILPEKIAEKRKHPQAKAIQTLCLLSLAFGGMLWPLAWLWAYSKPVLYKMAYGTDKVEHGQDDQGAPASDAADADELKRLREQVADLETKLAGKPAAEGEKA